MKPDIAGAALLGTALSILAASPAEAFCKFNNVGTYCNNCLLVRRITVTKGDVCRFVSTVGTKSRMLGVDTVAAPRGGKFGTANAYTSAYQAPAAAGLDQFSYRIRWENQGEARVVTIRNDVTIVERR